MEHTMEYTGIYKTCAVFGCVWKWCISSQWQFSSGTYDAPSIFGIPDVMTNPHMKYMILTGQNPMVRYVALNHMIKAKPSESLKSELEACFILCHQLPQLDNSQTPCSSIQMSSTYVAKPKPRGQNDCSLCCLSSIGMMCPNSQGLFAILS